MDPVTIINTVTTAASIGILMGGTIWAAQSGNLDKVVSAVTGVELEDEEEQDEEESK